MTNFNLQSRVRDHKCCCLFFILYHTHVLTNSKIYWGINSLVFLYQNDILSAVWMNVTQKQISRCQLRMKNKCQWSMQNYLCSSNSHVFFWFGQILLSNTYWFSITCTLNYFIYFAYQSRDSNKQTKAKSMISLWLVFTNVCGRKWDILEKFPW